MITRGFWFALIVLGAAWLVWALSFLRSVVTVR